MATPTNESPKLPVLFDQIWDTYQHVENTSESTSSYNIQKKLQTGAECCKQATEMINEVGLFSDNEELQEVPSNEIRYLLTPALLGYFTQNMMKGERLDTVKNAKTYYMHFMKLCKLYGVTHISLQNDEGEEGDEEAANNKEKPVTKAKGPPGVLDMANQRQNKIERYKQQKETEKKLKELYEHVQKPHVDEDVKREYYTTLLKQWVNKSLDEIDSLSQEVEILQHMAKKKSASNTQQPQNAMPKEDRPKNVFKPFILTKTDLQKQVFGAGYPSLPTYTVEEFYEQQVREGKLPPPGAQGGFQDNSGNDPVQQEQEAVEKEKKEETDDKEALEKARNWDDWKDDHRRGWGNRQNMG